MLLDIRLSASAIGDYKACPERYKLHYLYGLKQEKEKDSLRIGTNWHYCHEILGMVSQGKCPACLKHEEIRDDCFLCDGKGILPIDLMDSVTRYLNFAYKDIPGYKTHDEWELERINILYSLSAYRWYYGAQDEFEIIGEEIKFELPILNPTTRKKIGKAVFVGKVDELVRHKKTGLIYIRERKSTSKSLTDDTYWDRLKIDDQITGYLYGIRRWQQMGGLESFGISRDDPLVEGIYYDVWHKPGIAPKTLSQKDSEEFVESGEYCGEKFGIGTFGTDFLERGSIYINNILTTVIPGKKEGTFAIFETTEMFGARLIQDISERPEFYFAQRPIARTDSQLVKFEQDLAKYVALIRYTDDHNLWWLNDRACEVPFWCDFRSLCHSGIVIGPNDCPEGFKKRKIVYSVNINNSVVFLRAKRKKNEPVARNIG